MHKICRDCLSVKTRSCIACGSNKPQADFTDRMWKHQKKSRKCKQCMQGRQCVQCGTLAARSSFAAKKRDKRDDPRKCFTCMTKVCSKCKMDKKLWYYRREEWKKPVNSRLCNDCDRKACSKCKVYKCRPFFKTTAWILPDNDPGLICTACMEGKKKHGYWTCANPQCRQQKPLNEFSIIRKKHKVVNTLRRICDGCLSAQEDKEKAMMSKSLAQVQKR